MNVVKLIPIFNKKIIPALLVLSIISFINVNAKTVEEQLMAKAVKYFKEGKNTEAITELTAIIDSNPKSLEAYAMRESIYYNSGEIDKALADSIKMIEVAPNLAVGYRARAYVYLGKKEYDNALADFTKVIELAPGLSFAYSDRGLVYLYKKDYSKAWDDVHKAQSLGNNNIGFIERLKKESARDN